MKERVLLYLVIAFVLFCFFMSGRDFGISEQQELAAKAGAGTWKCDPITGKTEFVYSSKK